MRRKPRAGSDDTALLSKSWIAGLPGLCHLCKWLSSRLDVKHWKVLLWHQEQQTLEALRDPIRRPLVPRDPLPHTVVGQVEYNFIQNHFHPKPISSQKRF